MVCIFEMNCVWYYQICFLYHMFVLLQWNLPVNIFLLEINELNILLYITIYIYLKMEISYG